MSETRAGYCCIIGKPNAGKSTLMNKLMGEKLSIITSKPQTTRKRILGILTETNYQIVFLDTPGILDPKYLMQTKLAEYINSSVKDADVLLFVLDLEDDPTGENTFAAESVQNIIRDANANKILLLNKIDLSNEENVKQIIENFEESNRFKKIIPISALEGYNIESVRNSIIKLLPVHPKYYPDDQLSDAHERFFVSEIIREKIFERFSDEIPYSTEVVIEEFKEREERKDFISASIMIERESQKPIIIGKGGAKIKKLGAAARKEIEEFLQREVFLELRVKVKKSWRSDPNSLRQFGYDEI